MDPSLHERIAVVEAELRALKVTTDLTAADVRLIRDHIIVDHAARRGRIRTAFVVGGFLTGVASLWSAFGNEIRRLF
jgi:hypothetical protein